MAKTTFNLGSVKGSAGKSAYQSYLDTTTDNPKKSESEWVASLKGASGVTMQEVKDYVGGIFSYDSTTKTLTITTT